MYSPPKKSQAKPASSQSDWLSLFVEHFFVTLYQLSLVLAHGAWLALKRASTNGLLSITILMGLAAISLEIGTQGYHLVFLHWLWPALFSGSFMRHLASFSAIAHSMTLFILGVASVCLYFGLRARWFLIRLTRSFEAIGLTNHFGQTPKLIRQQQLDTYRDRLLLNANSLGLDRFESKRSDLEAILRKKIISLSHGSNPSQIEIILSARDLPKRLEYRDVSTKAALPSESFYIGESKQGLRLEKITRLPHLLIAGTTGGGKSVFFKQVLLSLLKSAPHLQLYLIDLKGGLEFSDFKSAPNARVVKTLEDAVRLLEHIEKEMYRRFALLEKTGRKEIDPVRDRKDRLVLAVDEASVLYAKHVSDEDDRELTQRARTITDSIAKLGRAAGIHLILATQKVMKDTVATFIQENISARMCFQMNTLHGSLSVLGSKDAMDLPSIPGRGIWLRGNERAEVQAPYLDPKAIHNYCQGTLTEEFASGLKSNFHPMLGEATADLKSQAILKAQLVTSNQEADHV